MPDIQRVNNDKEKILATIFKHGPSFPTRISRETGLQPLFVAAFLAELASERKVKISHMKVGSSPIYFFDTQVHELEKFTEFLGQKERDAVTNLKKVGILEDEAQHPVTRVALRKVPDFAIPVTVRIDAETKLFWRYFTLSEEETKTKIQNLVHEQTKPEPKDEPQKQEPQRAEQKQESVQTKKEDKTIEQIFDEKSKKKQKELIEHEFPHAIRAFLEKKGLTVTKELVAKKKEFLAEATHPSLFGEQTYLIIAKDKKKITQDDLITITRNARAERMPALVIATGKPDKKALEYLKEWGNLVKVETLE